LLISWPFHAASVGWRGEKLVLYKSSIKVENHNFDPNPSWASGAWAEILWNKFDEVCLRAEWWLGWGFS
jgi:hypothetical protein